MELLDIVDVNGNLTGEVLERDKVHELNLLHYEMGVFIVNKEYILLQKRSTNKKINPNMWGLCAGHVSSGESLEEAALRELKEEVGLNLTLKDLHVLENMEVRIKETNSCIKRYYYVFSDKKEFKIQKEELSEVKWFKIDDVIDMVNNNDETLTIKPDRLYLLEKLKEEVCKNG